MKEEGGRGRKIRLAGQRRRNFEKLDIEGTGGIKVKYRGYVEAIFSLPQVKEMEELCLFLVVSNSKYGKRVPIQIGTLHIDLVLDKAIKQELAALEKHGKGES